MIAAFSGDFYYTSTSILFFLVYIKDNTVGNGWHFPLHGVATVVVFILLTVHIEDETEFMCAWEEPVSMTSKDKGFEQAVNPPVFKSC